MENNEGIKEQAFFTAEATFAVLVAIIENKKLELLDTVLDCLKSLSTLLSFLQGVEKEEKLAKIFTDLIDFLVRSLGKHLSKNIACYALKYTEEEMKVKIIEFFL